MFKYLNRGISTTLAITIIIILFLILIGGILVYQYKFEPGTGPVTLPPKAGITFSDDCNELEMQINDLIEKANYCNIDSDCVTSDMIVYPFPCCSTLLNKNADLTKIKEGIRKYNKQNCPQFACDCPLLPKPEDIKCINNKCIDTRFVK